MEMFVLRRMGKPDSGTKVEECEARMLNAYSSAVLQ
jgi:hypothetical protein